MQGLLDILSGSTESEFQAFIQLIEEKKKALAKAQFQNHVLAHLPSWEKHYAYIDVYKEGVGPLQWRIVICGRIVMGIQSLNSWTPRWTNWVIYTHSFERRTMQLDIARAILEKETGWEISENMMGELDTLMQNQSINNML